MNERRFIPVDFETAYRVRPAWDTGRPQPALAALAEHVHGSVLDVGCGTGEHALFYAARGHQAWGIDLVPVAIEQARSKASERKLEATFRLGDALALNKLGRRFDVVIDSGLFHTLGDDERSRYVQNLHQVLNPGGSVHLLCFSEHVNGSLGPRRITQAELRASFTQGWMIREIVPASFEVNRPDRPQAWRALIERDKDPSELPDSRRSPTEAELAKQLGDEIEAIASRTELFEAENFIARAEALDRIEFHIIDRIRAFEAGSEVLAKLEHGAAAVTERLAQIDQRLFQNLRADIANKSLQGAPLRRTFERHLGQSRANARGYDERDLFVDGLLRLEAMPPINLRPREPEMFYYQPTPARIVFEMLRLVPLSPEDVFYDLGSGLGHVCILVHLLTGARTIGIEFEPAYCDYSRQSAHRLNLDKIEFINADAREANYVDGTTFFMYTPFKGAIMERVLSKIEQASPGRAVRVCTFGTCTEQVSRQPWLRLILQQGEGADALAIFERAYWVTHQGPH